MPRLTIQEGGQANVFEVLDDEVTIGRGASNAVQVADAHASKFHATIRTVAGRPKLVDLESKNGTRVNGEFRNQRWLAHGDVVSIGAATLTFDAAEAPAAARHPAAKGSTRTAASGPGVRSAVGVGSARGARRRDRGEGQEGDEEEVLPQKRRGTNSVAIAVLMGAGGLAVIALLFLMLSRSGASSNAQALAEAKRMWARGGEFQQKAYDFLRANSNSDDVDGYKSVKEELNDMERTLQGADPAKKEDEALAIYSKIYYDYVEMHKNGLTPAAIGARLRKLVQDYPDTLPVMKLLNGEFEPETKLRPLMNQR